MQKTPRTQEEAARDEQERHYRCRDKLKIKKIFSDYRNAVRTAGIHGGLTFPAAIHSVLQARLAYNLGPEFHSLFELWNKRKSSWPDYLSSYEMNEAHKAFSLPEDRYLAKDKLAFTKHCLENDLPTVPVICAIDHAQGDSTRSFHDGTTIEKWMPAIQAAPSRIFIKQIDGAHGSGAFTAKREGERWRFRGILGTSEALHSFCLTNMQGRRGWIVQPEVRPHKELAQRLSPRALCTARLVTYIDGPTPRMLFAALRIPVGDSPTDNWSWGLSGNLIAPIDLESGALGPGRTSRSPHWPVIISNAIHPDTGQSIEDYRLPFWEETKALALRAQDTLRQIPTAGWDIAITDSGPIIIETNSGYAIEMHQVALQRGLRRELDPTFSFQRVQ